MKEEHKAMIKELADLLEENSLNEIEFSENGVHLRVVRHAPATTVAPEATPAAEPKNPEFINFSYGRSGLFIPQS